MNHHSPSLWSFAGTLLSLLAALGQLAVAETKEAEPNTAKPVETLSNSLPKPKIKLVSDDIDPAAGGRMTVEVDFPLPPSEPPAVVLVLDGKETIPLQSVKDSHHYAGTVPAMGANPGTLLQIKIVYPDGVIQGTTPDREVGFGTSSGRLWQLTRIEFGEKTTATGTNGATREGKLTGLDGLVILFAGQEVRPSLKNATAIEITAPKEPSSRSYRVAVSVAGNEVASLDGILGKPAAGSEAAKAAPPAASETPADPSGGKKEITLPGKASDIVAADSGNILVITLDNIAKIALFDNRTLTIRGYLPLAPGPSVVAANADTVFIYYSVGNTLMSYRLTDLSRISSGKSPFPDTILNMVGGCASRGPLLVIYKNAQNMMDSEFGLLDPRSLRQLKLNHGDDSERHAFLSGGSNHLRASANGEVFGNTKPGTSPSGYSVLTVGRTFTAFYEHSSLGVVIPSWDGAFIYTANGIYRPPFSPVSVEKTNYSRVTSFIPAHHPNYCLKVNATYESRPRKPSDGPVCAISAAGSSIPLVSIDDEFQEIILGESAAYYRDKITLDKRFHFLPTLKRLVTLAASDDRLVIRHCDVSARLKEKGGDFLHIPTSPPPAKRGTRYQVQLTAESSAGGVTFHLESGAGHMTLTPAGLLTWSVPGNHPGTEFVIVKVKDRSGLEKLQTVTIHTD